MKKLAFALSLPFALSAALALSASLALAEPPRPVAKAPPLPPSTEDLLVASPEHAAWVPSQKMGMPAGAEVALIGTDPVSTGPTTYLKTRAGWHLPLHWHMHNDDLTLISGRAVIVIGGKSHALVPGSFVVIPSRAQHELTCDRGAPCLFIDRRSGPSDVHWVKTGK